MLSENVYVNENGLGSMEITNGWMFLWKCPSCGQTHIINGVNVDNYIDSDPHDPLQDYLICPVCEHSEGLFKGVEGISMDTSARLWADGTFVYLHVLDRDERIL